MDVSVSVINQIYDNDICYVDSIIKATIDDKTDTNISRFDTIVESTSTSSIVTDSNTDDSNSNTDDSNSNTGDIECKLQKSCKVNINANKTKLCIIYDETIEIQNDIDRYNATINKTTPSWILAKHLIAELKETCNISNSISIEYFLDYLDIEFKKNNDDFSNISKVYYQQYNTTTTTDASTIQQFDNEVAKYVIENLLIPIYEPLGYFKNDINQNKWRFQVIVITSKSIYSANRYIDSKRIGFY